MNSDKIKTLFKEKYTDGKETHYVCVEENTKITVAVRNDKKGYSLAFTSISNLFREIFLPQGYPDSVSKDYTAYQIWDTVQAFCSTITGTLSTHAIMKGVGVGDQSATPLAATITWVLKDGTGHVGRILFAWWKGSDLDNNSKKWRLVADVLNDIALGLELLLLPIYPVWSTELLCLTTAMKAIVGVAGGATRSALTQHHAVRGNLADVSAKDGSQETCVNLFASVLAILILHTINNKIIALAWFLVFTMTHIYANFKAVKSVQLKVLNKNRIVDVFKTYVKTQVVPTVDQINQREPVFFMQSAKGTGGKNLTVNLGCSIGKILRTLTSDHAEAFTDVYKNEEFCIVLNESKPYVMYVAFSKNHTAEDVLRAYWHCLILNIVLVNNFKNNKDIYQDNILLEKLSTVVPNLDLFVLNKDLENIYQFANNTWPNLRDGLITKGFSVDAHLLPVNEWRACWRF